MLTNLWLPILLSTTAVFFASFLSWMVLQFHRQDWVKTSEEDRLMELVRDGNIPAGNYMFPSCASSEEMNSEAFQRKYKAGPNGTLSVFPPGAGMGPKLGLQFAYFLAATFCVAYLATLALTPGSPFLPVFRFVSTATFLTHFAAVIPGCIWFHIRITGHFIDAVVFAAITGAIFGVMWPGA